MIGPRFTRSRDGATTYVWPFYPGGSVPGYDALSALAHALVIVRWSLASLDADPRDMWLLLSRGWRPAARPGWWVDAAASGDPYPQHRALELARREAL